MLKENDVKGLPKGFIYFMNISLILIMLLLIKSTGEKLFNTVNMITILDYILIVGVVASFAIIYLLQKREVKSKYIIISIVILGVIIRYLYLCSLDSVPISDYNTMIEVAKETLLGDFSELWGRGYIARFPHLTVPTLYFSTIIRLTDNYLWIIKIINLIASSANIYLIYLVIIELFGKKKLAYWGAFITATYPPLIAYTAVYCTENIAIPFYILSLFIFIKSIKGTWKPEMVFVSAFMLSIGNLFRMVAPVILVALIMYIWLWYKTNIVNKSKACIYLLLGFLVPLIGLNFTLKKMDIIEHTLWKGSEPSITNIVKGINISSGGTWTQEDAAIPYIYNFDYDKIEEACKEIIKERLTETPPKELAKFYINKFSKQWRSGDFGGVYWAEHSVVNDGKQFLASKKCIFFIQLYYTILILLSYIGLFNRRFILKNILINLFYLIFGGYGLFFMISETQDRYSFIVSWIFIIFALVGIDLINHKLKKE